MYPKNAKIYDYGKHKSNLHWCLLQFNKNEFDFLPRKVLDGIMSPNNEWQKNAELHQTLSWTPEVANSAKPLLSKISFYLTIKYRPDLLGTVITEWTWLPRETAGIKTNACVRLIYIFYSHFRHPEYRWEERSEGELRIKTTSHSFNCLIK